MTPLERLFAVSGLFALLAILLVVVVPLPPGNVAGAPTASASPTVTPDPLLDVPDACRADVQGAPFTHGDVRERARSMSAWLEEHPGEQASLVLTDEILTAEARSAKQQVTTEDTKVEINEGGFRLSSTVVFFGRYPISALLVPTVSGGDVTFAVQELDTDGMPSFMRPAVSDSIQASADPSQWGLDVHIDSLVTHQGCAVAAASR